MYSNIPLSHLTLNALFSLKSLLSYRWIWFLKIQFLGTSPQILEKERSEFLILDRSAAPCPSAVFLLFFFIVCCSNLFQFLQSDFFLLSSLALQVLTTSPQLSLLRFEVNAFTYIEKSGCGSMKIAESCWIQIQ